MKVPFDVLAFERVSPKRFGTVLAVALLMRVCALSQTKSGPVDPGVRGGPQGAGGPLPGLTADETIFFQDGQAGSPKPRSCREARTTVSAHASIPTNVYRVMRNRLPADRARQKTPCPMSPSRMERRTRCRGSLRRMGQSAKRGSREAMALLTAECTTFL